ncbi:M48 family metallopeptidase [Flavobacteriales bacterium]|nr:M48 family metallopeptidase [Flavobacteriales bacterium]
MSQNFFQKTFLSIGVITVLASNSFSQKQNFTTNYELSNCQGEIPTQFKLSTMDKITNDIASDGGIPSDIKINTPFYESYRYSQNKLLLGGKILFGDEMSIYVNKVAHNLLDKAGRSELKQELNIYILKSDIVNALCMPDGTILITVGLLSQIENEAQLAFVIAHEITHYTKGHAVQDFRDALDLKKEYRKSDMTYQEAMKQLSDYSKDNELESDEEGYKMFTDAGYDSEEANKMLLVLQYSYLPFDEVKFDSKFFNDSNYIIPAGYFPDSSLIETVEDNSDEDDTYSTHPNIETRVEKLDEKDAKSGVVYYFDEEEFQYINTKARFENQNIHLVSKNFVKAVYECYLLKKKFPNNIYLDQCLAKGLYGASKMNTTSGSASRYEDEIEEGNLSLLYKVFNSTMSDAELNVLALKELLELNDSTYNPFIKDLVFDLYKELDLEYSDFITEEEVIEEPEIDSTTTDTTSAPVEKKPEFKILNEEEYADLTKVQKIRYNEKKRKYLISIDTATGEEIVEKIEVVEIDTKYYIKAFFESPYAEKIEELFGEAEDDDSYRYFSDLSFSAQNKLRKERQKRTYKYKEIEMDSVLIFTPYYESYDKNEELEITGSLEGQQNLSTMIAEFAENSNVSFKSLDMTNIENITTAELNNLFLLNEWKLEMDESYGEQMVSMTQNRVYGIFEEMGYDKILLAGVYTERTDKGILKYIALPAVTALAVPGFIPVAMVQSFQPGYYTYKYVRVLDKDGYIIFNRKLKTDDKPNYKQDEIYFQDVFNQIILKNDEN